MRYETGTWRNGSLQFLQYAISRNSTFNTGFNIFVFDGIFVLFFLPIPQLSQPVLPFHRL